MTSYDNLQEYQNASRYDAEYGVFEPDGPFFLSLAKQVGSPVLDIACGTGRLTVPIAKTGLSVTGIDISNAMLEAAKTKYFKNNIDWVQSDATHFKLDKAFKMALLGGNAFQAFLTQKEQQQVLENIKTHLLPGGILAFGIRNLRLENLET